MYVLLIALITGFAACEGPEGPPGPAGEDGIDGVDGQDGEDGNANVIASDWITPAWSATNSTYGYFRYPDTLITEDLINTGVLLSYADWTGLGQYIYALPFSFESNGTVSLCYNFYSTSSEKSIMWWFSAENNYTPNSGMKLRYVIIPASNSSDKALNPQQEILYDLDKAGVDVNDYYQVMNYFGLDY